MFLGVLLVVAGVSVCPAVFAQGTQQSDQDQADQQASQQPLQDQSKNKKAKGQSDRSLYKELSKPYQKWLDEDVVYIITPEERHAFLHLQTNEEREQFIEASGADAE